MGAIISTDFLTLIKRSIYAIVHQKCAEFIPDVEVVNARFVRREAGIGQGGPLLGTIVLLAFCAIMSYEVHEQLEALKEAGRIPALFMLKSE